MMRQIKARIRETPDNLLYHPSWYAAGHICTAAFFAASIAFGTAQTSQIGWLAQNKSVWYGTASVLPILSSALVSLTWHRFGAPWLRETSYKGWVLHSFVALPRHRIQLNMPAPETYLIIAAAASAGAVITLNDQTWLVRTLSATLVGAMTAGSIVLASPSAGAVAVRGNLALQAERTYQDILTRKANTQQHVLTRQRNRCAGCGLELPRRGRRFAIIDENRLPQSGGFLNQNHIKAVCPKCAATQTTTRELEHGTFLKQLSRAV